MGGGESSHPPPPLPPRLNITSRTVSPPYFADADRAHNEQGLAHQFGTLSLQRGNSSRSNQALAGPALAVTATRQAPTGLDRVPSNSPRSNTPAQSEERQRVINATPRSRKILSLDGGGVRGLSIIMILRHLMRNLNRKREVKVQPWEEFDMIGGTSTGAIIAIMLGRLRMSLEECERAYIELSSKIFKPSRHSADPRRIYDFLGANGKFDPQPLEESILRLLEEHGLADNELLQDNNAETCRVFVCATRAVNSTPAVLRSYETSRNDPYYDICEIWEAVRATSAASTFFPEIRLGRHDEVFVDGAFRRNNPIRVANIESAEIWPEEDRMFISIGTGTAPGRSLLGNLANLAERLKDIVTDTEQTNRDFRSENRALIKEGNFYRFNVDDGSMADIGLEEYQEAAKIASNTNNYLEDPRVEQDVNLCIERLPFGGQRLGWVTREEMQANIASERLKSTISAICEKCFETICHLEIYFYCSECSANLCGSCQPRHLYNHHATKMHRIIDIPWSPQMQGILVQSDCSLCSRLAKCRVECLDCLSSLCFLCASSQSNLWLAQHRNAFPTHRSFRSIMPPYWTMDPITDKHCPCFNVHGVIGHCNRCLKVLLVGDAMYLCKTCRQDASAEVELCDGCISEEHPEHLSNHIFFCFKIERVEDLPDDLQIQRNRLWHCQECAFVGGPEFPHTNQHLEFRLRLGDAVIDYMRYGYSAKCIKNKLKECQIPNPPNATGIKCSICTKLLALNIWNKICVRCDQLFCSACIERERVAHRHILHWVQIDKLPKQTLLARGLGITCDTCGKRYHGNSFTGLSCTVCWNFFCCFSPCLNVTKRPPLEHIYCRGQLSTWQLRIV